MSKHANKHKRAVLAKPANISGAAFQPKNNYINTPPVWAWLLTTLLFILLSGSIAPVFWSASFSNNIPAHNIKNIILGVCGIFAFLIEPLVIEIYAQAKKDEDTEYRKHNGHNQGLLLSLLNMVLLILLAMPAGIIYFLRPVFRAMLLYTSFVYLKLPGGESLLFVTVVMLDIALYYVGMWSSKLSLPGFVVRYFNIKSHPRLLSIGTLFFIFHNALIYFLIASIGYNNNSAHKTAGEQEVLLASFWILATLYTRLPFLPDDINDLVGYLGRIPRRYLLFQIVILTISFVTYMWPYFMGWR